MKHTPCDLCPYWQYSDISDDYCALPEYEDCPWGELAESLLDED